MSLSIIESALRANGRSQSVKAWVQQEDKRAEKVARFRRYADGDHDNHLTPEQRRLLNIRGTSDEDSTDFNDNICGIILDTMLDRINLLGVKADSETATNWIRTLLERERIDALQIEASEATLRDGNSYLMVYPDPVTGMAHFSQEPAYDGAFGTLVMYENTAARKPMLAVKVWKVTSTTIADTTRVNVYYDDRIERFVSQSTTDGASTSLTQYSGDGQAWSIPWLMPDGTPIGVPFVHFKNRGSSADSYGLSELENIMPLQNALNVDLTSIVVTALLSGFNVRGLVGAKASADIVPGRVESFYPQNADGTPATTIDEMTLKWLQAIRFEQWEVGDLSQLISAADWLKAEMYTVTNTPTDDIAADASGEARKQSEVKLIGKVKRFCVKNGNAWEDAVRLAQRVETAYARNGTANPPTFETVTAQWADPEVRNDSQFVDDMLKQYREGVIDLRTYLESVQDIFGWDDAKIDKIIKETERARNQQAQQEIDSANAITTAKAEATAMLNEANGSNGANQAA